jgi:membrane fusion protein, macrolide-specific efflux system
MIRLQEVLIMDMGTVKKNISVVILMVFCLSMVIIQTACSNVFPKEEAALAVPLVTPAAIDYKTQAAALSSISNKVTMHGKIFALTQQNLYFTYEKGRLKEMSVEVGDQVKTGDVLATINTDTIDLQVKLQKLEVKKAQIYYDAAAAGTTERQIAYASLQQQQLQLDALESQKEGSTITAPFDGVITYTYKTAIGELVAGYETIVTIADPSTLMVTTDDALAVNLSVGGTALLTLKDNSTADGLVVETPATLDPQSVKSTSAFLTFSGGIPAAAKNGADIKIDYVTEQKDNVIVLAKKCVISANNRKYVSVLENGLRVEKDVEVGISNETDVEIVSGLAVGDLVILN